MMSLELQVQKNCMLRLASQKVGVGNEKSGMIVMTLMHLRVLQHGKE